MLRCPGRAKDQQAALIAMPQQAQAAISQIDPGFARQHQGCFSLMGVAQAQHRYRNVALSDGTDRLTALFPVWKENAVESFGLRDGGDAHLCLRDDPDASF